MSETSDQFVQPTLWDTEDTISSQEFNEISVECKWCGLFFTPKHLSRRYCSPSCKKKYNTKFPQNANSKHVCRNCGNEFPISINQHNKWYCSKLCQKTGYKMRIKEFYTRRPLREAIYRERRKSKGIKDGSLKRFLMWNPDAPKNCESCGEKRVLEIAHKPNFQRLGERRSKANCKWPEMVWVLCPTCHSLLDVMNYSPDDLNLKQ